MDWGAPLPERVGDPALLQPLLERGLAANPANALLHEKLGYLHFDRKQFAAAAEAFETALRLGTSEDAIRLTLARCYTHLRRWQDVLDVLASSASPAVDRGRALLELGRTDSAEVEFRAVSADEPGNVAALRLLGRILRKDDRHPAIIALCEELAERGAANAQLFYLWGWSAAIIGDDATARRLLFDPAGVSRHYVSPPPGFADIGQFNASLSEDILANPNRVSDFPVDDEANRGSQRVDDLFTGPNPALVRALLDQVQQAVAAYRPHRQAFGQWARARPTAARLRPWGLIQRNTDYEEGHIHPNGWLSGVYYVRVPRGISEGKAPGSIQFEPPKAVVDARPDLAQPRQYIPVEGMLLVAPSHYQHRTIASGIDEYRISVAFDVVPDA